MEIKPHLRAVSDQTEKKPLERNARKLFCIIQRQGKLFLLEMKNFLGSLFCGRSQRKSKKLNLAYLSPFFIENPQEPQT